VSDCGAGAPENPHIHPSPSYALRRALELGVPLPTDADFASRTSEAEREQQREDSIAAATER
jgi:hypothetical protein